MPNFEKLLNTRIDRRSLGINTGKLLAGAASSAVLGCGPEPDSSDRVFVPTNGNRVGVEPQAPQPIDAAIQRLRNKGIAPSSTEAELWKPQLFIPDYKNLPAGNDGDQMIIDEFESVLEKSASSENPYLASSGNLALNLRNDGTLYLQILRGAGRDYSPMVTTPGYIQETGSMAFMLGINADFMATITQAEVAIVVAHEMEHVKNVQILAERLLNQGIPIERIPEIDHARSLNRTECVNEESLAYAVQSEIYIHQRALVPSFKGSYQEEQANAYVAFGQNSQNPQWKQAVALNSGCLYR